MLVEIPQTKTTAIVASLVMGGGSLKQPHHGKGCLVNIIVLPGDFELERRNKKRSL